MHNVIVMSEGVEAMTLRTIAGISCLNLLQNLAKLIPSVTLRGEGRSMSELNITMALNSVGDVPSFKMCVATWSTL